MKEIRNILSLYNARMSLPFKEQPSTFFNISNEELQVVLQRLFGLIRVKFDGALDVIVKVLHDKEGCFKNLNLTYQNCFWNVVLACVYFNNSILLEQYLKYLKVKLKYDIPELISVPYGKEMNVYLIDECIDIRNEIEPSLDLSCLKVLMKYGIRFDKLQYAVFCQTFGLLSNELERILTVTNDQAYQFRCQTTLDNMLSDDIKAKVEKTWVGNRLNNSPAQENQVQRN